MTKIAPQHEPHWPATPFQMFHMLDTSAIEAALKAGITCAQAWLDWQAEILVFISNRFVWDSRISEALAACKTPADVAEVQKDWLLTTALDCSSETARLFQFAWKLVPSLIPPVPATSDSDHVQRRSMQSAAE